jgi:type I restriction enzyme R subunit
MNEKENEKQTRKERIDKRLVECGWQIVTYSRDTPLFTYSHHAVREYPTDSGPVDYALFCEGKIIGVIEVKRLSLDYRMFYSGATIAKGISQSKFNFYVEYLYIFPMVKSSGFRISEREIVIRAESQIFIP